MNMKIQIIKKALAKIERRLQKINEIRNANPISEIISLRKKASVILDEHGNDHAKISELLKPLAAKEKSMFAIAEQQTGANLIDEEIVLQREKRDLLDELHFAELKTGVRR